MLWLQVDAGDADPATLAESLDALFVAAAGRTIDLPVIRADDLGDLAAWLRRRIRRVLQHLPPPWFLVFDNHQELPADSPLQADIAARVGSTGHLLITDISAGILALAERKLRGAGCTQVEALHADAQHLLLDGAGFDAAICRLGLMFCTSPQQALQGILQALAPGRLFQRPGVCGA